jgi:PTH1 family peptidyl-tRNA hydrolase
VKVIAGLGNPGIQYAWSRHNIGFQVVERFAETHGIEMGQRRFDSLYGSGWVDSQRVILLKPMTFMNRSGQAIKKALDFFNVPMEDLIVTHDDMDLPFGTFRFKRKGGDGGHQGVRSIIEWLGGNQFQRLKIGIGRPPEGMEPAVYVLAPFSEAERTLLDEMVKAASEALTVMLLQGIEHAMNRFQKKKGSPGSLLSGAA